MSNPWVAVYPPVLTAVEIATNEPPPTAQQAKEDRKILQNIRSLSTTTSMNEKTILNNNVSVGAFCFTFIQRYHFKRRSTI